MPERVGLVVLAAGAGMRLGGVAKALLRSSGNRTFLQHITDTARRAGLHAGVVVVGPPHGTQVAAHAADLGLRIVENVHPERGMASSVALGFAAIAETDSDAAWLWPVDHPDVDPTTLDTLIEALGTHACARPTIDGRGGHPPLVARRLWPQLVASTNLEGGARAVLAAADTVDVAVLDPGCIRDVDTAIDLEAYEADE